MTQPIVVEDLHLALGGRPVLRGVSFTVQAGDVFGFLGPNGAGKTTTIRALLGLYPPDRGALTVLGEPAGTDAARQQIGFVLDDDGLYDGMSAAANIAFWLQLYGRRADPARIAEVLDLVGLADRADDPVGTYSTGMRRRCALARAIAHRPPVVVLDEPTSGVDPGAQREIRDLLRTIASTEGATILLSSHNLEEVQRLCNRIAIIADGEIQLAGELTELRQRLGRHTITVEVDRAVPESIGAGLAADERLGLREVRGTRLRFVPPDALRTADLVARLDAAGLDVLTIGRDDATVEDLFAAAVAVADEPPHDPALDASAPEAVRSGGGRRREHSRGRR
jgi:ABC-2 type transport system ATP-binding protein